MSESWGEVSTDKPKTLNLQIQGQDALDSAPPFFCNFVGISRLATEVQFEFIFLDLNQMALLIGAKGSAEAPQAPSLVLGQTVAKIVMPAQAFVQLKDHVIRMFSDIEKELMSAKEVQDARTGTNS
jgi:hypothetical protein